MPLPTSGVISLSDVNVELGRASNSLISLNDSDVRALAGKPSGPISLSDLYGASAVTYGYDYTQEPTISDASYFRFPWRSAATLEYRRVAQSTKDGTFDFGSDGWVITHTRPGAFVPNASTQYGTLPNFVATDVNGITADHVGLSIYLSVVDADKVAQEFPNRTALFIELRNITLRTLARNGDGSLKVLPLYEVLKFACNTDTPQNLTWYIEFNEDGERFGLSMNAEGSSALGTFNLTDHNAVMDKLRTFAPRPSTVTEGYSGSLTSPYPNALPIKIDYEERT